MRRDIFGRIPLQSDGPFVHVEMLAKANFLGGIMAEDVPLGDAGRPVSAEPRDGPGEGFLKDCLRVFNRPDFGPTVLPTPLGGDGMSLRFTVLASGSGGNASLVETDGFGVLIDAGLGPRQLATAWPRSAPPGRRSRPWSSRTPTPTTGRTAPSPTCTAAAFRSIAIRSAIRSSGLLPRLLRWRPAGLVRPFEPGQEFAVGRPVCTAGRCRCGTTAAAPSAFAWRAAATCSASRRRSAMSPTSAAGTTTLAARPGRRGRAGRGVQP